MALAKAYIEAPTGAPIKFGLFSVADVQPMSDPHWNAGTIWENDFCGLANVALQPCDTDAFVEEKEPFNVDENTEAEPLTVYAMAECRGPADFHRGSNRAVKALNNGAERAVERGVWQRMMGDASIDDLTPGTVTDPVTGLAILEREIANVSPSQAVIHMPRNLATVIGTRAIERHGNHLETILGSLVAAGAGYSIDTGPGGSASVTGETWMIATGPLRILRGTSVVKGPFFVQSPLDNTYRALAEQNYVPGWECAVLAIRVTDDSSGI